MPDPCPHCATPLVAEAYYCYHCGKRTALARPRRRREGKRLKRDMNRAERLLWYVGRNGPVNDEVFLAALAPLAPQAVIDAHPDMRTLWPLLRRPVGMVTLLLNLGLVDDRPLYRFALGAFEAVQGWLGDPRSHEALDAVAAYVDRRADEYDMRTAHLRALTAARWLEHQERRSQGFKAREDHYGGFQARMEFIRRQAQAVRSGEARERRRWADEPTYMPSAEVLAAEAVAVLACVAIPTRHHGPTHREFEPEGPHRALAHLYHLLETQGRLPDREAFELREATRLLSIVGNPFLDDPDLLVEPGLRARLLYKRVCDEGGRRVLHGGRREYYSFGVRLGDGTEPPERFRREALANMMAYKWIKAQPPLSRAEAEARRAAAQAGEED